MKLISVIDRAAWDAFQLAQPYTQFLQSWAWGEFRSAQSSPVRRFSLEDEAGVWQVAIQLEYRARRFGMGYWFAPRGPVFAKNIVGEVKRDLIKKLCEALLEIPELRRRTLFWRFEALSKLSDPEALFPLAFRRAHAMNPATSAILDLAPSESELLANLHEKTRYNIRVAAKHNVSVRFANSDADLAIFLNLMEETAKRDGFVQHPRSYLEATYHALQQEGMARIRLAECNGKILSANLEITFGDTVTYLYGSSSSEDRHVMAPFALHWEAIKDTKSRGLRNYDFGGANPQSKAMFYYKQNWEGITRFKKSWGANCINFVGTWDLPFNIYFYRLVFWRQFFRG